MIEILKKFPFFIQVLLIYAVAMIVPVIIALEYSMYVVATNFFLASIFIIVVASMIGILLMNRRNSGDYRSQIFNLFLIYVLIPPILAIPIALSTSRLDFWQASFEMLSSMTTTGATLISTNTGLMLPILTYSALVAWIGAFIFLLIVYSIMEPAEIGGFEIITELEPGRGSRYTGGSTQHFNSLTRYFKLLAPPYFLATALLVFLLTFTGERFLFAFIHSWSVMSSSGISPYANLGETDMHLGGEFIMFIFLFFGVSRHFILDLGRGKIPKFRENDPEIRVFVVILAISTVIFAYFFLLQEFETRSLPSLKIFLLSIWGMLFTVVSFLTTHGYISEYWQFEVNNIEIHTSSIYLLGLAMLGGGVATTAGGIKLLRIYALSRLAARELGRMIDPESIAPSGIAGRQLRRRGGLNAFVFLMLFMAGISTTALLLTALGLGFEEGLMSAISATTNCGPILKLLPQHPVVLTEVSDIYLGIFGLAMIFGRVEVFVVIALLNPNLWFENRKKLL